MGHLLFEDFLVTVQCQKLTTLIVIQELRKESAAARHELASDTGPVLPASEGGGGRSWIQVYWGALRGLWIEGFPLVRKEPGEVFRCLCIGGSQGNRHAEGLLSFLQVAAEGHDPAVVVPDPGIDGALLLRPPAQPFGQMELADIRSFPGLVNELLGPAA